MLDDEPVLREMARAAIRWGRRHGTQHGSDRDFLHVRGLAAWEFERTKIDVVTGGRH